MNFINTIDDLFSMLDRYTSNVLNGKNTCKSCIDVVWYE